MKSDLSESEIYNIENFMDKFLNDFDLDCDSLFYNLIVSIIKLKISLMDTSGLSLNEYEFWLQNSPRKLDTIPKNWESIKKAVKCEPYEIMFSLETAYTLFGKLLVSKIAEDLKIPGILFSDLIKEFEKYSLKGISEIEKSILLIEMVSGFTVQMRDELYEPIFEEDIFLWWSNKTTLSKFSTITVIEFAYNLIRIIIKLRQYFFKNLFNSSTLNKNNDYDNNKDIIYYFYQSYIDASTRKSLGEFFTSLDVVELITDHLGYKTNNNIENSRFIDLSCGSGSFIDLAFERYIDNILNRQNNENINWESVLHNIYAKPLIVGLDINPFAVQLSQLRIMIRIMEIFKKAKENNPYFRLKRLPIFRTDSIFLEKEIPINAENLVSKKKTKKDKLRPEDESETKNENFLVSCVFPIKGKNGDFIIGEIFIPKFETFQKSNSISTVEDYYSSYQALFDTMKRYQINEKENPEWEKEELISELQSDLKHYFKKNIPEISGSYVDLFISIMKLVRNLKGEYANERIVKLIEDAVLAIIIKNYFKYNYVAGNPPYLDFRSQNKNNDYYKLFYAEVANGQPDHYVYFLKRGIDILAKEGKLCYILSNQWLYTGYGRGLRKYLLKKMESNELKLIELIDFRDQMLFSDAVNLTAISLFEKDCKDENIKVVRVFDINASKNYLQNINSSLQTLEENKGESFTANNLLGYDYFLYNYRNLTKEFPWSFKPLEEHTLFVKIKGQCSDTFDSLFDIHTGTQTSADQLYKVEILSEDVNSLVVRVKNRRKEVFLIERSILRSVVRERVPISKWIIRNVSWLIFPYFTQKNTKMEEYSHLIDIDEIKQNFPLAYTYFTIHEKDLKKRENIKTAERNFHKYAYEKNHLSLEKVKLIPQSLGNTMSFALDYSGSIFLTDAAGRASHILKKESSLDNYKLLLALFNSKSYDFFSKNYAAPYGGGSFQFNEAFSKNIPVPFESLINWQKKKEIIGLVNEIIENLALKNRLDKFPNGYFPDNSHLIEYEIKTSKLRKISDLKLHISNYSLIYKDGKKIKEIIMPSALQAEALLKIVELRHSIDGTEMFSIPSDEKDIQNAFDLYRAEENIFKTRRKVEMIENEIEKLINEFLHLDERDLRVINKFHLKFTNKIDRGVL